MPRVLVVGGGGREHALADALIGSPSAPEVIVAPGNAGIARSAPTLDIAANDIERLTAAAVDNQVDLVVVGPEAPLVLGLADALRAKGILVLGPSRAAAQLEGSKTFAKTVMDEGRVPTARWGSFRDADRAIRFARDLDGNVVVKADGLAGGKGVVVADDLEDAERAISSILSGAHGEAGSSIVVEERLEGEELSVIALTDGARVVPLAPAQDHKRVLDGDRGPNTGGMGAYSPAPRATPELVKEIEARCLEPIIRVMNARSTPFSGILYAGLMLTKDGPKVLEYNVRFGDPEAQAILARLEDDAYLLFRSVAEGQLSKEPVYFSKRSAVTIVLAAEGYPGESRRGDVIQGIEAAERMQDVFVHHAATKLDQGAFVTNGGRILNVTALGDDLVKAAERAYEAVRLISFRGMHYRCDIAHRAIGRAVG
jgi:phosphoribosylamine---glycine ligase